MERSDLSLVCAIRESGSLTAAATALGLHAPAVTKRLAALESQLGVRLFFRTTRRVTATAEGEPLCERAAYLLASFADTEEALRDQAREPAGLIRIAATFGFGRIWLGAALAQFQSEHPKVRIDLQLTENLPDLAAESFDAAVWLWAAPSLKASQWSATMLAKNERVLVASPEYLAARGRPKVLEDLRQHECLQVRESDTPQGIWLLSREGQAVAQPVKVRGPLVSNSGELVRDWCVQGHGIMLRSVWDVSGLLMSGQLVRVLPKYAMLDANIQWLAPFRAQTPKRVQLLREFLLVQFKKRPWEKA